MHSNHIYKEMFTTHFQQYRYIISISLVLEWFFNSYGCFFSIEELFQALLGNFQLYNFLFLLCLIFPPNKGSWRREGNSGKEVLTALIVSWGHVSVMINALSHIASDGETWVTIRVTFFGTGDRSYSCVCAHVCSTKEGRQQRSTVRHQRRDSKGLPLSLNWIRREISLCWCSSS